MLLLSMMLTFFILFFDYVVPLFLITIEWKLWDLILNFLKISKKVAFMTFQPLY